MESTQPWLCESVAELGSSEVSSSLSSGGLPGGPGSPPVRVVVTGLGMVSAAGTGVASAWSLVQGGKTGLRRVELFDSEPYGGALAGEAAHLPREPGIDRSLQLLLLAADELISDAAWENGQADPDTGVVLGTSQGAIEDARGIHREFLESPYPESGSPEQDLFAHYRPGYGAELLAEHIGARGPRATMGMVCVSSSVSIIHAVDLLRRGAATRMVAGGFESFSQFVFTGFYCIGALASGALRPFDDARDGTVLGEGAVLLALETLDSALERGASIYAEVVGGGYTADAFHMTAPDPEGRGLERATRMALQEARMGPGDIDYICAHGTGTVFNDGMECKAFARIFAELAAEGRMPPISSLKSVFGHTLGAAGALDALISVLALRDGVLPPTVAQDAPIADWDFVIGAGRKTEARLEVALSTNSAFGGNNSALVLRSLPDGVSA